MPIDEDKLLKQIDTRFEAFGRRLTSYEVIRNQNQSLQEQIKEWPAKYSELVTALREIKDDIYKRLIKLEQSIAPLQPKIDSMKECHMRLAADHERTLSLHDCHKKEISQQSEKCKTAFKEIEYLQSRLSSFADIFEDAGLKIFEVQKDIKESNDKIRSLEKDIDSANKYSFNALTVLRKEHEDVRQYISKFDNVDVIFEKKLKESNEELHQRIDAVSSHLDHKIESIKMPDISGLATKEVVTKLQRSLDLSSIDARNAYAKSNNNEMQNQLLSKKIESLQIAIKSHELGNGR